MSIFVKSTLSRPIQIAVRDLCGDVKVDNVFKQILEGELEGKCTVEGFVKKGSVQISKYSVGILKEHQVHFTVEFTADVLYPVKDQVLKCEVIGPNHYGLHCKLKEDEDSNACDIYIPRDHHHPTARLNKYSAGSDIDVKVAGARYEVNDTQITVIAYIHDAMNETAEVGESLWTVEYVDEIKLKDIQDHPEKTYVVDTSLVRTKKELTALKKSTNVRVLDVQAFSTFYNNKEIIQPFIESLHDAKTLVFPYHFADSVRTSEETYAHLKTKLVELGFQPVREAQSGGGKKKEETFVGGDY
jgi:DNA-directed RNA polymerase subunit E'/Rpb7